MNLLQSEHEKRCGEYIKKDEANQRKLQEMTRENEVLKNQLKKYVATVQMLRKDKILSEEAKEGEYIYFLCTDHLYC